MAEHKFDSMGKSFLDYMMIKAITKLPKNLFNQILAAQEAQAEQPDGKKPYTVVFSVNGVELPLEKAFKDIKDALDEMVERKAVKLLDGQLSKELRKVNVLSELVEQAAKELHSKLEQKLGIKLDDDGWYDDEEE